MAGEATKPRNCKKNQCTRRRGRNAETRISALLATPAGCEGESAKGKKSKKASASTAVRPIGRRLGLPDADRTAPLFFFSNFSCPIAKESIPLHVHPNRDHFCFIAVSRAIRPRNRHRYSALRQPRSLVRTCHTRNQPQNAPSSICAKAHMPRPRCRAASCAEKFAIVRCRRCALRLDRHPKIYLAGPSLCDPFGALLSGKVCQIKGFVG